MSRGDRYGRMGGGQARPWWMIALTTGLLRAYGCAAAALVAGSPLSLRLLYSGGCAAAVPVRVIPSAFRVLALSLQDRQAGRKVKNPGGLCGLGPEEALVEVDHVHVWLGGELEELGEQENQRRVGPKGGAFDAKPHPCCDGK